MVVAHLPAIKDEPALSPKEDRMRDALADAIFAGHKPADIAKRLAPENKQARKNLRQRIRRMVYEDVEFQTRVANRAKGEMILGLGEAVRGLVRAAGRGRPDAIKLLFEASGFHSAKVQHQHSGEVTVKLASIPRPEPVVEEAPVDAEVVDEA